MVDLRIKLPEHFLDGETRDGYYVSPEMKKVWAVELDLLNEFMRVCDKHNLHWFADGGTILGAVRHKGFIPWDDDIDVMMLREDYNRLCTIAHSEFSHPYFFQNNDTDLECTTGHSQLRNSETTAILYSQRHWNVGMNQGIFIDIFPIDNVPDFDEDLHQMLGAIQNLKEKSYNIKIQALELKKCKHPLRFIKRYIKHIWLLRTWPAKCKMLEDKAVCLMQEYNNIASQRVAKLVLWPFDCHRRVWKKKWLAGIKYMKFEFLEIPVPNGYKEILDQFYGDWKTYKVGNSTHGSCLFDTEISYKEYLKKNNKTGKNSCGI